MLLITHFRFKERINFKWKDGKNKLHNSSQKNPEVVVLISDRIEYNSYNLTSPKIYEVKSDKS